MSTPTDPYSSSSRRPFDNDDILAPLTPEELEPRIPIAPEDQDAKDWDAVFTEVTSAADPIGYGKFDDDAAPAPSEPAYDADATQTFDAVAAEAPVVEVPVETVVDAPEAAEAATEAPAEGYSEQSYDAPAPEAHPFEPADSAVASAESADFVLSEDEGFETAPATDVEAAAAAAMTFDSEPVAETVTEPIAEEAQPAPVAVDPILGDPTPAELAAPDAAAPTAVVEPELGENATLIEKITGESPASASTAESPTSATSAPSAPSPEDATEGRNLAADLAAAAGLAGAGAVAAKAAGAPAAATTAAMPATNAAGGFMTPVTPEQEEARRERWAADPGVTPLNDVPDAPRSRVPAHVGALLATLILVPVAWYLISDTAARLFYVTNNPWDDAKINFQAIGELVGALAAVALIWLLARVSSLGAIITGTILTVAGFVALFMPGRAQSLLETLGNGFGQTNDFTANVVHHLNVDLGTGHIVVFGFVLLMTGLVSHSARRRGQRTGAAITRRALMTGETNAS